MPLFIRPEKTLNQHVMDAQPKRIFHYAAFRYLFFARLFTVLGNGIAPIALAFAVLDIGGTPAQLGIVVAARSLFNVIFLMLAACWPIVTRAAGCCSRPQCWRLYRRR